MAEEEREEAPSEQPQRRRRQHGVAFALDSEFTSLEHHQSGNEARQRLSRRSLFNYFSLQTISSDAQPQADLDSTIIDRYKGVGQFLSQYTSGEIPIDFKLIPDLELWEEVLFLTEPQNWSDNAMYEATKIFSSSMYDQQLQIFYKNVLLPRVRGDIRKNRRLRFALCQSLKESLSKPRDFNNGILFPLFESGTCSVHEAVIIGGIIQEVSMSSIHSSKALLKLVWMDYCGATSYFIKLILDKNDALHCFAFHALLKHFLSFMEKETTMPVIWHQSLLSFVQRYKYELQRKDKDDIEQLMQNQKHYLVTPEIERELKGCHNCGESEDDEYQRRTTIWLIGPPARPNSIQFTIPPIASGQAGLGLLSSHAMWA